MKSLYIHIPFCKNKCLYCDFLSFIKPDNRYVKQYIDALMVELAFYNNEKVETVYIGGGTPSILNLNDCEKILKILYKSFNLSQLKEFTIEVNPESLSKEKLDLWINYGVNRISVGVQSFNDDVLEKLNRITRKKEIYRAYDLIKRSNIRNFNVDLILGVQDEKIYQYDIKRTVDLNPNHISVYLLSVGENTPLKKMIDDRKFKIPSDNDYERLYNYTVDILFNSGYRRYEISNFSKAGYESIHNINYWCYGEYIGTGLGAVSFIDKKRIKNCTGLSDYLKKIAECKEAFDEIEYLSEDKIKLEKIMLSLRMSRGIKKSYIIKGLNNKKKKVLFDFVDMLEVNGLIEKDRNMMILTNKGIIRSNTIISELYYILDNVV